MKTLLISQGGCGTNWLKARYGNETMCAALPDLNPHQRMPYCPPDTRILYLMANPINQLLSFERRGFFEDSYAIRLLGGNEIAFRNIHPNGANGGSLKSYAELGINCFEFAEHRKGWQTYAIQNNVDIRFVCYESLENPHNLWELDRIVLNGAERHTPLFEGRDSSPDDHEGETIEKLKKIHKKDIQDWKFVMKTYGTYSKSVHS